jgi:integrating conjugative element protein (TIGR03761 family)
MHSDQSTESSKKQKLQNNKNSQHKFQIVADLTLHTDIANNLFYATWKIGNIGLVQFASWVAKMYKSSQADDPYADWYLMKTYDALFNAKERLKKIEEKTTFYFGNLRGVNLRYAPTKPSHQELRIASPFSYMGACLLTDLDHILRQIIILRHVGINQSGNEITIKKPIKELQDAFAVPFSWKETHVTRADIRSGNQKAIDAKAVFPETLPDDVLNEEIEFSLLPNTKLKK